MTKFWTYGAIAAIAVASAATPARADDAGDLTTTAFDPSNAVAPISVVQGPGIKVGEGTVLHPVFGVETGIDSNVFYQPDGETAGVLRLMGQIGAASLNKARLDPNNAGAIQDDSAESETEDKGAFQYQANARVAWDQMLSGNDVVAGTGGLGLGAMFKGIVNPMGAFSFVFDEDFTRMIRAANFETTTNENRDVNALRLALLFHPTGRSVSGYLYYQNTIDVFESGGDQYPDRIDHRVGIRPAWQFLPRSQLYADVSIGYVSGLGSNMASEDKASSYPLIARLGFATLLTMKTSLHLTAGYTNGFYSAGPSFSSPVVGGYIAYHYSPLGRIGLQYDYQSKDSVNANFFAEHVVRAFVQQMFVPIAIAIEPEVHFREYEGVTIPGAPTVRDDVIFQVIAGIHYNFRNWIAATLDYKFSTVQTDFRYMAAGGGTVDPSYVRHEALLGLRVAL